MPPTIFFWEDILASCSLYQLKYWPLHQLCGQPISRLRFSSIKSKETLRSSSTLKKHRNQRRKSPLQAPWAHPIRTLSPYIFHPLSHTPKKTIKDTHKKSSSLSLTILSEPSSSKRSNNSTTPLTSHQNHRVKNNIRKKSIDPTTSPHFVHQPNPITQAS